MILIGVQKHIQQKKNFSHYNTDKRQNRAKAIMVIQTKKTFNINSIKSNFLLEQMKKSNKHLAPICLK